MSSRHMVIVCDVYNIFINIFYFQLVNNTNNLICNNRTNIITFIDIYSIGIVDVKKLKDNYKLINVKS